MLIRAKRKRNGESIVTLESLIEAKRIRKGALVVSCQLKKGKDGSVETRGLLLK